ncbi:MULTISPECIES: hypothetical protein [Dietzia]|uniref:Uncharacterized protein n=1 Tax=Dietzia maris TaxID=37915 RepID=A0ABT8H1F0_9ACTN|nr:MULTISPECIES: hypothetical protein [Dietzia]MBB1019517.1 hypothetical protein [Dietzia sp. DQ11-71]MDN4506288.1 hypothetical protein [Dietzia maris]OAV78985.1 hypothetical protein AYO52_10715 [Dietzia sp. 111N12-1]
MPPIDLNVPLFPSLPGTGGEQIGAVIGSIVLAPFLYATSQIGLALGLTGSLASVEMSVGGGGYYY